MTIYVITNNQPNPIRFISELEKGICSIIP
jgi:hypothetical protein